MWMSQPIEEVRLAALLDPVLGANEPEVKLSAKGHREVTVIVHRDDLDAPNLEETAQEAVTVIAEDYEHAGTIRDLEIRYQSGFDIGIFKSIALEPFTFSQEDIREKIPQDSA